MSNYSQIRSAIRGLVNESTSPLPPPKTNLSVKLMSCSSSTTNIVVAIDNGFAQDYQKFYYLYAYANTTLSLLAFCSCFGIQYESRHGKINYSKGFITTISVSVA